MFAPAVLRIVDIFLQISDDAILQPSATWQALCALQVKVQTVPGYAKGLMDGMPKVISQEGVGGCVPPRCTPVLATLAAVRSCVLRGRARFARVHADLRHFLRTWFADLVQHLSA